MTTFRLQPVRTALAAASVTVLAACASTPTTSPQLVDARAAYERAAADAQIARSAPLELQRAQEALQRGEVALRAGDDMVAVEHYAYLSRQRTAAARQAAELAQAEQAVMQARTERDRILIEARAREAEAARNVAEQRAAAAEAARQQAEAARQQAAAAETRAARLEAQLAEMKARKTDRGMVLTLGDVLFDTGRAELQPGAMRTIDQLAAFMKDNPERTLQIEGYTDAIGSDALNQALSERRAEAVRAALIARGIDMRRISARGFGESNPVASNDTAAGRQQNRRVEVVISGVN